MDTDGDERPEKVGIDAIPEFEVGGGGQHVVDDPTIGRPNDARSPGDGRLDTTQTQAYLAAIELIAQLPPTIRLPPEAAELVPTAFEAEIEQELQKYAIAQFDNPTPHVETIAFDEVDGEVWMRIRMGIPPAMFDAFTEYRDAFADYALEELDELLG